MRLSDKKAIGKCINHGHWGVSVALMDGSENSVPDECPLCLIGRLRDEIKNHDSDSHSAAYDTGFADGQQELQ